MDIPEYIYRHRNFVSGSEAKLSFFGKLKSRAIYAFECMHDFDRTPFYDDKVYYFEEAERVSCFKAVETTHTYMYDRSFTVIYFFTCFHYKTKEPWAKIMLQSIDDGCFCFETEGKEAVEVFFERWMKYMLECGPKINQDTFLLRGKQWGYKADYD